MATVIGQVKSSLCIGHCTAGIWKVTNPKLLKTWQVILMPTFLCISQELKWWMDIIETAHNIVSHNKPQHTITTNASPLGWVTVPKNNSAGRSWTHDESLHHINYLDRDCRTSLQCVALYERVLPTWPMKSSRVDLE